MNLTASDLNINAPAKPPLLKRFLRAFYSPGAERLYAGASFIAYNQPWQLLVATYLNCLSMAMTEYRQPTGPLLPDIGFAVLPHLPLWQLCDLWIGISVGTTVLRFAATRRFHLVVRRYFILQGFLFALRAICIASTNLPTPLADCDSTIDPRNSPFLEGLFIMLTMHRTCGDVLFSGHTVTITLMALFWHHYSAGEEWKLCRLKEDTCLLTGGMDRPTREDPQSCVITKFLAWGVAVAGYFVLISTHFHYTVDVIIGFALSVLAFKLYHHYIKTSGNRQNLFNRFVAWYEMIEYEPDPKHPRLYADERKIYYDPANSSDEEEDEENGIHEGLVAREDADFVEGGRG